MATAYITAPREMTAELAESLVERRLAACVNVVDCRSTYRWDDEVVRDEPEAILLAKTTDDGYDQLAAWVETHHPHDVACIERFDETTVADAFGEWIDDVVE